MKNAALRVAILCQVVYEAEEQGQYMWQKCQLHLEPAFFCASVAKGKTTQLCPEVLRFKTKKSSSEVRTIIKGAQIQSKKIQKKYFCCKY